MDGIWGDFHIEQIYKSQEEKIKSIALKDVSVIREGRFILSHTSFSACAGQKICIIGNSGSEKSTLLKILAGIMEIQEGNLFINQKAVKKESGLTHQDLLLLAQSTVLFSATIEENITLFKDIPSDITLDAIDKAGLKKWFKDTGGNLKKSFEKSSINLSGGEQRRVDFARTSVEDADEKRGYIYNIIR